MGEALYEVRTLDESEYEAWDRFSQESEQGTFYTSTAWIRTIDRHFGKVRIVGVFSGEEIVAGCIFIERKIWRHFLEGAHMPLTPYSGILLRKSGTSKLSRLESERKKVMTSLVNYIDGLYSAVYIVNSPALSDIRDFIWSGWDSRVKYTYRICTDNLEQIWARFDNNLRRQIQKAQDHNIRIIEGDDFSHFYDLLESTYVRQDMEVPVTRDFLDDLNKDVIQAGKGVLFLSIEKNQQISAGAFIAWDDKRAYYTLGASDPEFLGSGAPSLLQWHIITFLHHRGLPYDLVGANTPSIVRHKRGFNPTLVPYYEVYKINSLGWSLAKHGLMMGRQLKRRIWK